jgi:ADP-ribosylglycohydrolase
MPYLSSEAETNASEDARCDFCYTDTRHEHVVFQREEWTENCGADGRDKSERSEQRPLQHFSQSLEAALWAFFHGNSFKEGCLLAVNLGDDADTTGAVYGQLAGAFYGEDGIPEDWREKVSHYELIVAFAEMLFRLSTHGKT